LNISTVPAKKGVYVLIIQVENDLLVKVGHSRVVSISKGFYIYVGSALKNLRLRLRRYICSSFRKKFWHIDYILSEDSVKLRGIVYSLCALKVEPSVALTLLGLGFKVVSEGLGSSEYNWKGYSHFLKAPREVSLERTVKLVEEAFNAVGLKPNTIICDHR